MRILRHHSIIRCIYALLIALPMFSVLGRVIYTQSNKNAKDSYYGETINQETISYYTLDTIEINKTYIFDNAITPVNDTSEVYQFYVYVTDVELLRGDFDLTNVNSLQFYTRANSYTSIFLNKSVGTRIEITNNTDISFQFHATLLNGENPIVDNLEFFKTYSYNKYSYLDNAFDYSLSRFVDENHWGKINFFDWFTSLFVDINYNNNALYLHFINWYMNYAMLVSCAYILFLVLMWFINFSRRLLERGMNYDW